MFGIVFSIGLRGNFLGCSRVVFFKFILVMLLSIVWIFFFMNKGKGLMLVGIIGGLNWDICIFKIKILNLVKIMC